MLEGLDRFYLTQDRDKCRGSSQQGNENSGSVKYAEFLVASQERICS